MEFVVRKVLDEAAEHGPKYKDGTTSATADERVPVFDLPCLPITVESEEEDDWNILLDSSLRVGALPPICGLYQLRPIITISATLGTLDLLFTFLSLYLPHIIQTILYHLKPIDYDKL